MHSHNPKSVWNFLATSMFDIGGTIIQLLCASGKRRCPMEDNITQGLNWSNMTCAYLVRNVVWWNVTSARTARICHCVCASARWPLHQPTSGNISQCWCTSGRRHRPIIRGIVLATLVVHFCIDLGLCTSLKGLQAWSRPIGRGLHTQVSGHRACPSSISLVLYTTDFYIIFGPPAFTATCTLHSWRRSLNFH